MAPRVFGPLTLPVLILGLGTSALSAWASEPFRVNDINTSGTSDVQSLQNVNGTLFFSANDGVRRRELWMSDETAVGTIMVAEINPGPGPS